MQIVRDCPALHLKLPVAHFPPSEAVRFPGSANDVEGRALRRAEKDLTSGYAWQVANVQFLVAHAGNLDAGSDCNGNGSRHDRDRWQYRARHGKIRWRLLVNDKHDIVACRRRVDFVGVVADRFANLGWIGDYDLYNRLGLREVISSSQGKQRQYGGPRQDERGQKCESQ